MNPEKLKKLQELVRIGGKGTPRRKRKVVHQAAAGTDDKKLQSVLKKLSVNQIPGIEEVNMFRTDATVINFKNPKTQASLSSNTFVITGHGEENQITNLLPGILSQLGPQGFTHLKQWAADVAQSKSVTGGASTSQSVDEAIAAASIIKADESDIPELTTATNFEEVANKDIENLVKKTEEVAV